MEIQPTPQPPPVPQAQPVMPPPMAPLPGGLMRVPAPPQWVTPDDCSMGMLCHLLAIISGFIGPLILWLIKKDQSRFIDHHGREALNFHLSFLIYYICLFAVTFVLMFVFVGVFLLPVVFAALLCGHLVFPIIAAVAANRGEWYRYPLTIRFL